MQTLMTLFYFYITKESYNNFDQTLLRITGNHSGKFPEVTAT